MSAVAEQCKIEPRPGSATPDAAGDRPLPGVPEAPPAQLDPPGPPAEQGAALQTPSRVAHLLRIRVPIIACLARRRLPVRTIRQLAAGTILEFEQSTTQPCELLVNNQTIGMGQVVRVGGNFGLQLGAIAAPAARIRSLGR